MDILEGVKEDSDGIYEHHKILVRLLFMALSRVYTEEELVVRIRAWKKKFKKKKKTTTFQNPQNSYICTNDEKSLG